MATRRKNDDAQAWPLGALLTEARGELSIREAARRAGISESRWRQVERGAQSVGGGVDVPVHPKPETVVAMAKAVGAEPAEALRLAGHDPNRYQHLTASAPAGVDTEWFSGLDRAEREAVLAELQRVHLDTELARNAGKRSAG